MTDRHSLWDDAEIISCYVPEIIPNQRAEVTCDIEDFEAMLSQFIGTEQYHADSGLLLTDGVKYLLDVTQGYKLLDFITEHLSAIGQEEAFTVIDLSQDGTVKIHDGRENRRYLALDKLNLALPYEIRLFTGVFDRYLVVMLASEY